MMVKRWFSVKLFGLIKRAAYSKFLQSIIWGTDETKSLKPLDFFKDSAGNKFTRYEGFRELVIPRFAGVFDPAPDPPIVNSSEIFNAKNAIIAMENFIQIHGYSIKGKNILEVGCHGGAHAYAMIELGAKHVDGIDTPQYGIRQTPGKNESKETIDSQSNWLQQLREKTARLYEKKWSCSVKDNVDFFDLNVINLNKENTYDAVMSWQTLEHITDPRKALDNMFQSLRAGGIGFHVYNPFFCINGGHSLCTLDFPYGHARLSHTDFENYIQFYRPQEFAVAKNFFYYSLNRMTLSDLKHYCESVGFEILDFIPWHMKQDLGSVNEEILSQVKTLYPRISLSDLLSRSVWIVLKKPSINL
jgi:2-polyprenyl-3-methyl-5-hydroxy-6-metoxy-1,4-benzoquinol methylase